MLTTGSLITASDLYDAIYPVGSIYMSVNSTSPATLFGGTWTQLKDRFLLGVGDTYTTVENTGGAASQNYTPAGTVGSHTLTTAEIPSHTHGLNNHVHSVGAHAHGLNNHVHSVGAHAHGLNNHVHSVGAHAHGLNSHVHSGPSHTHTGSAGGVTLTNPVFYTSNTASGSSFKISGGSGDWYRQTGLGNSGTGNTGGASGSTANSSAFNTGGNTGNTANSSAFNTGGNTGNTANSAAFNTGGNTGNTTSTGSGGGHNHGFTGTAATISTLPPYLTVYMWKRTA